MHSLDTLVVCFTPIASTTLVSIISFKTATFIVRRSSSVTFVSPVTPIASIAPVPSVPSASSDSSFHPSHPSHLLRLVTVIPFLRLSVNHGVVDCGSSFVGLWLDVTGPSQSA